MTVSFEAVDFCPVRFIGRECEVSAGKTARAFWKKFRADGSVDILMDMPSRVSPRGDLIGWMGDFNADTKTFFELPGVFAAPGAEVPEGFGFRDIPGCLMGVCSITGDSPDLERGAHNKTVRAMKELGFEPDYSLGFSMEYYAREDFAAVKKGEGGLFTFRYYLPCKRLG